MGPTSYLAKYSYEIMLFGKWIGVEIKNSLFNNSLLSPFKVAH